MDTRINAPVAPIPMTQDITKGPKTFPYSKFKLALGGSDSITALIHRRPKRLRACRLTLTQRSQPAETRIKLNLREKTVAWREAQVLEWEKVVSIRERKVPKAETIERSKANHKVIKRRWMTRSGGRYKFSSDRTVLPTPQQAGFTTKEMAHIEKEIAKIEKDEEAGFTTEETGPLETLIAKIEKDEEEECDYELVDDRKALGNGDGAVGEL